MSISRKHAASFFFSILPMLFLALAEPARATPAPDGAAGSAGTVMTERQIPIVWKKADDVQLQPVAAAWQPVALVKFSPAGSAPAAARQDSGMVRTGSLSWAVTASGTQVLDNRTGSGASIPNFTSSAVRPRDVVYDKQSGTVWFYGDSLYRYQFSSHTLEKLRLSGASWQPIRKMARGQAGLWLAAGNAIFLLDAADGTLKRVQHAAMAGMRFINVAAGEREAWFATADARLVRVGMPAADRLALATSAAMPGAAAELAVAGQTVWLLLTDKHGDYYRLAYVNERQDQLGMMTGRYFALSEKDGQLTASAYATQLRIDPASKTATAIRPVEAGLLAHASRNENVLYAGSSYGYKDGCEVVEHGQLDISKGWTTAMGDPVFR